MAELVDLRYKIKKYYTFSKYEVRGICIAILAVAFIISFREWGIQTFDPAAGLFNLFNALLIVGLSFLVHDAGQRIWALAVGFKYEFKMWPYGLVFALVIAFLSRGTIWLIIPGGFLIHHMAGHRLGFFRYGVNYFAQAMIALAGPLFILMLIILLKILNSFAPSMLLEKAILFNVVYLVTCMLPIPPLDGSKIYFGSRMVYAFTMPAMIAAAVLMIIDIPILVSLILSMLVGVILWVVYYISFERKVWSGPK